MNKWPKIKINISEYRKNVQHLKQIAQAHNLKIAAVTKVFTAQPELVKILVEEKIDMIADSRIENLKQIRKFNTKILNLRIPMQSEIEDLLKYSDVTLVSELATIKKINAKATKPYDIILMVDLGDLREGIFNEEEVYETVEEIIKLQNINLLGLGNNLSCFGGVLPTTKNLGKFEKIVKNIEAMFNIKLKIISGGSSGILSMIDKLPKKINQIRSGAALALGIGLNDEIQPGFSTKVFTLEAEIVELKIKPSIPIGKQGLNSFGQKPSFVDCGDILRAILAIGKQDVDFSTIVPQDARIKIIGGSGDHLVVDVTKTSGLKVGSKISFNVGYGGVLNLMTSKYVAKEIIKE